MKKRTTITTRRKEVWVIRQMPTPKTDQDPATDASPSKEPNDELEQVKPPTEGNKKEQKR
jgi:hypothetical protein